MYFYIAPSWFLFSERFFNKYVLVAYERNNKWHKKAFSKTVKSFRMEQATAKEGRQNKQSDDEKNCGRKYYTVCMYWN
jgi:hypothetical protein